MYNMTARLFACRVAVASHLVGDAIPRQGERAGQLQKKGTLRERERDEGRGESTSRKTTASRSSDGEPCRKQSLEGGSCLLAGDALYKMDAFSHGLWQWSGEREFSKR